MSLPGETSAHLIANQSGEDMSDLSDHPLYAAVTAALKATNEADHHYITHISMTVALEAAQAHILATSGLRHMTLVELAARDRPESMEAARAKVRAERQEAQAVAARAVADRVGKRYARLHEMRTDELRLSAYQEGHDDGWSSCLRDIKRRLAAVSADHLIDEME